MQEQDLKNTHTHWRFRL